MVMNYSVVVVGSVDSKKGERGLEGVNSKLVVGVVEVDAPHKLLVRLNLLVSKYS